MPEIYLNFSNFRLYVILILFQLMVDGVLRLHTVNAPNHVVWDMLQEVGNAQAQNQSGMEKIVLVVIYKLKCAQEIYTQVPCI